MKRLVLYGLVFGAVLSSRASAQEFEVTIAVSDDANAVVLTLGVHSNGTDGFEAGLDAFAPPPPPAGAFDARSDIGGESFITDIRDNATTEKVFHVHYQPASDQGSIILTWDNTGLSGLGSFFITDDVTGELFGPMDMTTVDRLDVSMAGGLLDNGLRVLMTPAGPQENMAPVAQDDDATTDEDVALDIDVLINDTDPDGDALSVTQVSDPSNGTTSINAGGTVRYMPDADFHGDDSFTYTARDPGGLTGQGTVTVTVTPVNDAPVITSTPVTNATEGQPYNYTATVTDVDGDPLTLSAPTLPPWLNFSDQEDGTAMLTGTPASSDLGGYDVVIEASDGVEMIQQAFTVTVSVQGNSAPTAQDDQVTTDEDVALDIDVLTNDTDPDGDTLSLTQVSDPSNGTASANADGTVHYLPDADFNGGDSFTYTVRDPGGLTAQGTVIVTVTPVNDAPLFTSTPVTGATLDEAYSYVITAVDVDGDALTVTAPTRPAWLAFADQGDGTAMLEGTPSQTHLGSHDVLLEVTDGTATQQQAFTITVASTMSNLPPSATTPTTPADGATVRLEGDPGAAFVVVWNAAGDPNGDLVHYRWELSLTRSFSSLLFSEDVGTATRFETTVGAVATTLTREGMPVGSQLRVFHHIVTSDGTAETVGPVFVVTLVRGVLVGVESRDLPERLALLGNYPNPFNPETTIHVDLPETSEVSVVLYDVIGREVKRVHVGSMAAGPGRRLRVKAGDLPSGTYVYRVVAQPTRGEIETAVGTMMLIK